MYTQCPDCQTQFRVTAVTLRAARGTVRCGRCFSAFDALARLSDSVEAPAKPVELEPLVISAAPLGFPPLIGKVPEESASEPAEVLVDEGRATETITLEGERVSVDDEPVPTEPEAAEPQVRLVPAEESPIEFELEEDLDATDCYETLQVSASEFPDEREAERELEALVQRLQREFGSDIDEFDESLEPGENTAETELLSEPATPELDAAEPVFVDVAPNGTVTSVPDPWVLSAPEAKPEPPAEAAAAPEKVFAEAPVAAPPRVEHARRAAAPAAPPPAAASRPEELSLSARRFRPAPVEMEVESEPERSAWPTLAWTAGSLLLTLVLAAQVVHHWRDFLARDVRAGGTLRAVYEQIGLELPPSRDLAALELRQLEVDDRGEGRMVVRASLTNRAAFAQPMPILRLQLEDRFGSMIAARDFEPAEYLLSGAAASPMLTPGGSGEAELVLADPGGDAVGYRLDVCLRDETGQLLCARPSDPS